MGEQEPESEPTRFAVYDNVLTQYVTIDGRSSWDSKADAGKAQTAAGKLRRHEGHKLSVRPVG